MDADLERKNLKQQQEGQVLKKPSKGEDKSLVHLVGHLNRGPSAPPEKTLLNNTTEKVA